MKTHNFILIKTIIYYDIWYTSSSVYSRFGRLSTSNAPRNNANSCPTIVGHWHHQRPATIALINGYRVGYFAIRSTSGLTRVNSGFCIIITWHESADLIRPPAHSVVSNTFLPMACRQAWLFQMGTSTSRRDGLEEPRNAVAPHPAMQTVIVLRTRTID